MHYHAGWNLTGYLPEADPVIFTNASEAKDYILEELEHVADSAGMVADESEDAQREHNLASELEDELANEDVSQGWSGNVEHVSYWIEPCPIAADYTSPCCGAEVCTIDNDYPTCAGCEERLGEDDLTTGERVRQNSLGALTVTYACQDCGHTWTGRQADIGTDADVAPIDGITLCDTHARKRGLA